MKDIQFRIGVIAAATVGAVGFVWLLAEANAARPTSFETITGAGMTCTRLVEERIFTKQVVRGWECKDQKP